MTTKRTPTLATLKKLAKTRGCSYVERDAYGYYQAGTDLADGGETFIEVIGPHAKRMLFAALSALPDAKGGKK